MKAFALLFPGALFAVGLLLSGMYDPAKVLAFLDVAGGAWDPSLAFVMVGAIGTFAVLNQLVHRRERPLLEGTLPGPKGSSGVDAQLVLGATLFGVGWGLGGVCPGPALTDLGSGRVEILAYVGAMLVGMVVAQRVFGADAPAKPQAAPAPAAPGA